LTKTSLVRSRYIVSDTDPKAVEALHDYLQSIWPKAFFSKIKPADGGGYLIFADFPFEWGED
jgi:hypothetical protein